MSQYEKLDFLIFEAVKAGASKFDAIFSGAVKAEADRMKDEGIQPCGYNGKPAFRYVDTRLQALRKRGLIVHAKGRGWSVKEAS